MSERVSIAQYAWRRGLALLLVGAVVFGMPTASAAEPIKCQRSILKQRAVFEQALAKALRQCELRKRKGKLPRVTVCASEPATAAKITKAELKLRVSIAKGCGGRDKTCGTADDDTLPSIAWPAVCPDFAERGCALAIGSCTDIAACVGCVGGAVVDQAMTLAYGALVPTDRRQQRKLYKCQGALGAELLKLYAKTSKPLGKCWDKRYRGKHAAMCPEPGDGKAARSMAKARSKFVAKICRTCGGADKACGGGDDFLPTAIGFAETCPAIGGCGGPVATLTELTSCLTCIADVGVGCAVSLSVPGLVAYPDVCAAAPPALTPTPTATTTPAPSSSATPLVVGTPTTAPTPCSVSVLGAATTLVTISLTTGQPVGAASLLLDYLPALVRLPAAGGGVVVRDRVSDLTGGELLDGGAPNNQDTDGDQVPDRLRLSLVSTTGVTGTLLTVEFDRCDAASATSAGDYVCSLAHVVGIDGVTSIAGVSCAATVVP